tara:strand:- start:85 stop:597 length:513 start_codon:yes stop_codon:yes gene_type:complete
MNKNFSIWLMLIVTAGIITAAVVFTNTSDEPGIILENNSATTNEIRLHVPLSQCKILPKGSTSSYFGEASGTVVNKTDRVLRMDEWVKVFVTWHDESGTALYESYSFIDVHSLEPGATSSWQIDDSSFWNSHLASKDEKTDVEPSNCSIHFQVYDVVVVPTLGSETKFIN